MDLIHLTVKQLPKSERPYEKCEKYGKESLTDAELIAVVIKSGSKNERSIDLAHKILMLDKPKGLNALHNLSIAELTKIKGIGKVKAIQLQCIAELSKRMAKSKALQKFNIDSPSSVANCYMEEMRFLPQEHLKLIMLDTKNNILKEKTITKGTVNASLITPREIFIEALRYEAVHIILLHNHPSGDSYPSKEDITITKRIQESGKLIGIYLLDHIIIGDGNYVSLKEKNFIF